MVMLEPIRKTSLTWRRHPHDHYGAARYATTLCFGCRAHPIRKNPTQNNARERCGVSLVVADVDIHVLFLLSLVAAVSRYPLQSIVHMSSSR